MPSGNEELAQIQAETDDLGPVWKRFGKILLRFYPAVLIYIVAVTAGTGVWAQLQTPLFKATATVLVDASLVTNQAERQNLENLALQAALITSPGILNKVIERYNLNSLYPFNQSSNPLSMVQTKLSVKPNIKSKTLELSFMFLSGEQAAKIANAIAETYVFSSEEKTQGTTQDSITSLQANFSQEMEKLEAVKVKIEEFKKQFPDIEDETTTAKQIDYFNTEMTKADANLIELRTKLLELEEYKKETGSILNHPYILENPVIDKQMERIRVAESNLEELKHQYREMHPDVIAAQARLDSLQKSMQHDQNQIYEQLKLELKTQESTRERMRDQLNALKDFTQKMAPQKIQLKRLVEEEDAINKTIKLIQDRMSVASVEGGLKRPGVTILNRAKAPAAPAWPNKPKFLLGAFLAGLVTSLGSIFLYCYFDRSIRSYEDVELVTGKLFLGDLTYAKVKKGDMYPEFPSDKSFILFTHGLRLIATNIEFVMSDKNQKVVLFSSSVPGEGKSFVSFHIAQSMARQGKRVILIDADFCQSSLRDKLPRTDVELHLHEYLAGSADVSQIIEKTDNDLVDFIRSGGRSAFSAPHALKSNRMKDLLELLKQNYDYVLIDTPPILPVNDTMAVSQIVDMRVIVVRWGRTSRDLVRKAVQRIAPGSLVQSGVVLNQVKESLDKGYHIYRPN